MRAIAGANDVALLEHLAVLTDREGAAVVTHRDDAVEHLERA